jgi:hypothetical protein
MEKTCRKCSVTADETLFTWSKRDGYGTLCKPCAREYSRVKRTDLGYVYKQKANKYNTDVDTIKTMFEKYKVCQICNQTDRRELCVDHCHSTGKVRGLLCDPCNKALGLFKDSPELLNSAIKYLGG